MFRGTDFCPGGIIDVEPLAEIPCCQIAFAPQQWLFLQLGEDIHAGSDVWAGNLQSKRCCQINRNSDLRSFQFGLEGKSTSRMDQPSYSSSEPQGTALPKRSAPFPLKLRSCQSSNTSNMKEYPTVADELVHTAFSLSQC